MQFDFDRREGSQVFADKAYTYELVETDGTAKPKNFGEGLTFFFYKDAFKEWTYRYGS